jgi:acetoacetyl-CoA reductase
MSKGNGSSVKVALVTGGIGGIGTEICKALHRQGRRVVAGFPPNEISTARIWQETLRGEGFGFELAAGDVSSFEDAERMVAEVVNRFGSVDILVNCAGITKDKLLRKMDWAQWDAVLSTNLDSVFNVTRHVVDGMVTRSYGRIVNISSVNGQKGQFGQTKYSAAKAGVHGFTMALAQEVAYKGITVNTVSPGYVATRMTLNMQPQILDEIVSRIPLGRMGEPKEVAHTVSFLCEDGAAYITGANIPVNGGLYMS